VWERTLLRYTWQVNIETRKQNSPERDERQLLPEMVPPGYACDIIAASLHELRVKRGIAFNGPSGVDVRNWFQQRANVDTWDKPYHPRNFHAYVRRQVAIDDDGEDEEKKEEQARGGDARLSFLNMLATTTPLKSPQDILRTDDLHYFLSRSHELMSEAHQTGQVVLPFVGRAQARNGKVPVVFSDRVVRALHDSFGQSDEAREWMAHTRPADPGQFKKLVDLRERINHVRPSQLALESESRSSHVNWFKRPVVDRIESVQQIVDWSRRQLKRHHVQAGAAAAAPAPEQQPSSFFLLFYRNEQMVSQARMMWEFLGRPVCSKVLPYLMTDAQAVVSAAHPLSRLLRFMWQVPPQVLSAFPLPATVDAARALQANLSRLQGAHIVALARAWSQSYIGSRGDGHDFFWSGAPTAIPKPNPNIRSIYAWALARGGSRTEQNDNDDDRILLHWCGMRAAFLCGCQQMSLNNDEEAPLLLCTDETHDPAWQQLQRLVWWLHVVRILEAEDGRVANELAHIWTRVLVQGGVPFPLTDAEKRALAQKKKAPKDQVLRAFAHLLQQWLWGGKHSNSSSNNNNKNVCFFVQLMAHGFLSHLEWFENTVKHLLSLDSAKASAHLPHFASTLEMCAGNVFQWLLTNSTLQQASFSPAPAPAPASVAVAASVSSSGFAPMFAKNNNKMVEVDDSSDPEPGVDTDEDVTMHTPPPHLPSLLPAPLPTPPSPSPSPPLVQTKTAAAAPPPSDMTRRQMTAKNLRQIQTNDLLTDMMMKQ